MWTRAPMRPKIVFKMDAEDPSDQSWSAEGGVVTHQVRRF